MSEPTAADWEKKIAALEQQVSGLAAERNEYRQRFQDLESRQTQYAAPGGHVLDQFGEGYGAQVDAYYRQFFAQQGYITEKQAQQMADARAQQAYTAARGDAMIWRTYDKLVSNPKYAELSNMGSDLAKKTAEKLQQKGCKPLREGASFDEWQYTTLSDLQDAADKARLDILEAQQAAAEASAEGQKNQEAAALAAGDVSPAGEAPKKDWKELIADGKGDEFEKQLRESMEASIG